MNNNYTHKPMVTGEWRKILFANYAVPAQLVEKYLPRGVEIDMLDHSCYLTVGALQFLYMRVLGFKTLISQSFGEVNLRFYAQRTNSTGEVQRGVVFIRQSAPPPLVCYLANLVYKEHYSPDAVRLGMRKDNPAQWQLKYTWQKSPASFMQVTAGQEAEDIPDISNAHFFADRHWGFTKLSESETSAYKVDHPKWQCYMVHDFHADINWKQWVGPDFEFMMNKQPDSVMLLEGSDIVIRNRFRLS